MTDGNPHALRVANILEEGRWGGPPARVCAVATRLRKLNVETHVILPRRDSGRIVDQLERDATPHTTTWLNRLTRRRADLVRYALGLPFEIINLAWQIRRLRPDLVQCNGIWQFKGIIAAWLARTPSVLCLNDTNSLDIPGMTGLLKALVRLPRGIIYTGHRVVEYYGGRVPALRTMAADVIPPPVDVRRFTPSNPAPTDAPEALLRPGHHIVTVANVNPLKGLSDFVEMASEVSRHFPEAHFHVFGAIFPSQATYHESLIELAGERGLAHLHFHGQREDLPALLPLADVFICSSLSESGPMSVWEAMAAALPVVSTDVGDVAEYVRDDFNGYVTAPGNGHDMTGPVLRLLADTDLRARLGRAGREVAVTRLDVEFAARRHEQLYRKVITQP
ncbi:MAG: glycosyltransferase family 4 protein [Gammaproteobacteria bacterium]